MHNPFLTEEENLISERYLKNGYIIFPFKDTSHLLALKDKVWEWSKDYLNLENVKPNDFFDKTQDFVSKSELNEFRVHLINKLSKDEQVRPLIYKLAKEYIDIIVGNELAMQRAPNLSIQLPKDDSSLLPLHSDVWSGNSPYEIVFWLPLVDCFKTKSMYALPIKESQRISNNFSKYSNLNAEELYKKIEADLDWFNVPFGHGVIFTHTLLHGNIVNQEESTRWTFNVRFKGLLTPYAAKELGESFLPISIKPSTRVGHDFVKPEL